MAERDSIAPPVDAARISAQLLDHGIIAARGTLVPDPCRACGRLTGHSNFEHQRRVIRYRVVQAGLMSDGEPTRA